jgi:nitrogen fixation protein FixH
MTRRFTGRHMLFLMLAFFGTVVAVNMLMATLATRTFGGTVVDNSYVASQEYNHWLAQARAQKSLGWSVGLDLDPARHVAATIAAGGRPLDGAEVYAVASHPLGRAPDTTLAFAPLGDGRYRSNQPLPDGRWILRVNVERGPDRARLIRSLR